MDKPSPSFDGLLTDYALGEIDDPEVAALIEALLERDEALRATLADIRSTTELVVLAGAQSLAPDSRPQALLHRWPTWAAVAAAAAVALLALAWLRPPAADSDAKLAESPPLAPASSASASADDALREAKRRAPWMVAAVDRRPNRTTRRGAGVSWASLAVD